MIFRLEITVNENMQSYKNIKESITHSLAELESISAAPVSSGDSGILSDINGHKVGSWSVEPVQ